jgi:hypothetical protein
MNGHVVLIYCTAPYLVLSEAENDVVWVFLAKFSIESLKIPELNGINVVIPSNSSIY